MALAELGVVVLDCPDPRALAGFYAEVLGGTVEGEGEWVDLKVPGGQSLAFQAAEGFVPPKWPSPEQSQQFHLDLTVEDLKALDQLRPRLVRLSRLTDRGASTDLALGSDIMSASLQVYNALKTSVGNEGLDPLRKELGVRFARSSRQPETKAA